MFLSATYSVSIPGNKSLSFLVLALLSIELFALIVGQVVGKVQGRGIVSCHKRLSGLVDLEDCVGAVLWFGCWFKRRIARVW